MSTENGELIAHANAPTSMSHATGLKIIGSTVTFLLFTLNADAQCFQGWTGNISSSASISYTPPAGGRIRFSGTNFTVTSSNGTYEITPNQLGQGILTWEAEIDGCPESGGGVFQVGILPVTRLNISAEPKIGKGIDVSFGVGSQKNNDKFEIERSKDGRNFIRIGEFKTPNGNTDTEQRFNFTHTKPAKGQNHYRIKQTDLDGQSSYSDITNAQYDVNIGYGDIFRIYPSIASQGEQITIEHLDNEGIISVYDIHSRKVNFERNGEQITINGVPGGVYYIKDHENNNTGKVMIKG